MIRNCDPLRRCWDNWWDQNIKFEMMDQLSRGIILAEHRIEPEFLSVPLGSNEHFVVEDHAERGGRPMLFRKLARRIV